MVSEREIHGNGDHRLVTIPTAGTTVTFVIASSLTSTSDNSSTRYFDYIATGVSEFCVVANQGFEVSGVNSVTFTDAIPVPANTIYQENVGAYVSVKVRSLVDNTQISIRVR